uniref:Uncharacterized protein n=1 Tax=Chrysotila carterae TaxID=13221 RepID=A0A7S4BLN9_CHRCT
MTTLSAAPSNSSCSGTASPSSPTPLPMLRPSAVSIPFHEDDGFFDMPNPPSASSDSSLCSIASQPLPMYSRPLGYINNPRRQSSTPTCAGRVKRFGASRSSPMGSGPLVPINDNEILDAENAPPHRSLELGKDFASPKSRAHSGGARLSRNIPPSPLRGLNLYSPSPLQKQRSWLETSEPQAEREFSERTEAASAQSPYQSKHAMTLGHHRGGSSPRAKGWPRKPVRPGSAPAKAAHTETRAFKIEVVMQDDGGGFEIAHVQAGELALDSPSGRQLIDAAHFNARESRSHPIAHLRSGDEHLDGEIDEWMDRYNSSGDETSATAPAAAPRHVAHTGAAEAPPPPPMSPPPRLAANERMSKSEPRVLGVIGLQNVPPGALSPAVGRSLRAKKQSRRGSEIGILVSPVVDVSASPALRDPVASPTRSASASIPRLALPAGHNGVSNEAETDGAADGGREGAHSAASSGSKARARLNKTFRKFKAPPPGFPPMVWSSEKQGKGGGSSWHLRMPTSASRFLFSPPPDPIEEERVNTPRADDVIARTALVSPSDKAVDSRTEAEVLREQLAEMQLQLAEMHSQLAQLSTGKTTRELHFSVTVSMRRRPLFKAWNKKR